MSKRLYNYSYISKLADSAFFTDIVLMSKGLYNYSKLINLAYPITEMYLPDDVLIIAFFDSHAYGLS